jgi:GNAT superfamily N-acetyltransferase
LQSLSAVEHRQMHGRQRDLCSFRSGRFRDTWRSAAGRFIPFAYLWRSLIDRGLRRTGFGPERTFDIKAEFVDNRRDPTALVNLAEAILDQKSFAMDIAFPTTTHSDVDTLVAIRIAAMRESLERIGRFDPQRARERFLASFNPALCRFIEIDGVQLGFLLIRPREGHWLLDHLYILPEYQGKGIGAAVLRDVFANADAQRMPIRLGALRGSDSNRFYQRHGFVQTDEAEWDIYYVRKPSSPKVKN